ncbi:hypothetical protein Ancab_015833 [Ancistrocladus abbreviatus]
MGFFGCFGLNKKNNSIRRRSSLHSLVQNEDRDHFSTITDHEAEGVWQKGKVLDEDGCCGLRTTKLKRYRWEEIQRMTMNFYQVIGVGGFSRVYLAYLPDSSLAAVKVYSCCGSERLSQVFRGELDICRQLDHANIVQLIGYCDDREGALVSEYLSNGTLQDKLHIRSNNQSPLPWKTRMAIAYQLAQSLEYLHEKCSLHIVHGDIKSSNILLDTHLDPKLCDFGSAKMGFQSMVRPRRSTANLMGSPGYIDPHYLMTGIASKNNDIYSFGVIVLELITGIEAFCSEEERILSSMVRRKDNSLEVEKVVDMLDERIVGEVDREEATAMASIAALCLHHLPSLRPCAADVCRLMKEKISSVAFLSSEEKLRSLEC